MTLTVSVVRSWTPASLDQAADELDAVRRRTAEATDVLRDAAREVSAAWIGQAADAAGVAISAHTRKGEHLEDALAVLRRALRGAADAFGAAQSLLEDAVSYAASHGLTVQEDGTVLGPPSFGVPASWTAQQVRSRTTSTRT